MRSAGLRTNWRENWRGLSHAELPEHSAILESKGPLVRSSTMPLYEYKCGTCGDVFEVIQKFSDTPLTVHENCGGGVGTPLSPSPLHVKKSRSEMGDILNGANKKTQTTTPPPTTATAAGRTHPTH